MVPRTNPITFAAVRRNAFEKISQFCMPAPIPVTTVGGTSAAAIAIPTKSPGMLEDIAIPPAIPKAIASAIKSGEISVLSKISSVSGSSKSD